jgi:hypothetical protein
MMAHTSRAETTRNSVALLAGHGLQRDRFLFPSPEFDVLTARSDRGSIVLCAALTPNANSPIFNLGPSETRLNMPGQLLSRRCSASHPDR